jgi:hypothetical protein
MCAAASRSLKLRKEQTLAQLLTLPTISRGMATVSSVNYPRIGSLVMDDCDGVVVVQSIS